MPSNVIDNPIWHLRHETFLSSCLSFISVRHRCNFLCLLLPYYISSDPCAMSKLQVIIVRHRLSVINPLKSCFAIRLGKSIVCWLLFFSLPTFRRCAKEFCKDGREEKGLRLLRRFFPTVNYLPHGFLIIVLWHRPRKIVFGFEIGRSP